ncbi:hypothetical protein BJF79_07370 [Actinomadura sp. CNU-125]|nr:hypothetical protein BJF79_07370 [Actinomadura sp. CNU-125]
MDLCHQIAVHLSRTRAAADDELLPPLLLLGTSERVGSNWLSDTLRPLMDQHNEPLRQQLAPTNPLSALTTPPVPLSHATRRLAPLGRYWLTAFTIGKHTPTRQVIKETNLLFALPNLLGLFPDSPVAVLTRSPLGVADSFHRGDLFRRWNYPARYRQITGAARSGPYRALVPDDDPPDLVALVRLQVLNTLLLATALAGDRHAVQIRYETSVLDRTTTWRTLTDLVPELPATAPSGGTEQTDTAAGAPEQDFATTGTKTRLMAHLTARDANLIQATTADCLTAARNIADASIVATVAGWLTGAHLYTLAALPRATARRRRDQAAPRPDGTVPLRFVERAGTRWRNLLVANAEYAAFLNELHAAGLPNLHHGAYLLACPMPHERGGRLHHDPATCHWTVSPGYEQYPAYWVTWIGAAAFAARHGAALPTRVELLTAAAHCGRLDLLPGTTQPRNTGYRCGDVTPVAEPGRRADSVHHLIGNLQVWCADGPNVAPGPAVRWLHGAAWNTPGTPREVHRPRHRHLTGASRGVGIRLVARPGLTAVPPERIAAALSAWIADLDTDEPLHLADERLIAALTGLPAQRPAHVSQADGRLGAHVRPGTGPTVPRQLDEPVTEPQLSKLGQRDELDAADRAGVGTGLDVPDDAADPARLERHVHDMGAAAGQVVTDVQQPARFDVQASLLPHLPDERVGERLPMLDLPTRKRPGPPGVGVLIQQQDPAVLDDDGSNSDSDACAHPRTVSRRKGR